LTVGVMIYRSDTLSAHLVVDSRVLLPPLYVMTANFVGASGNTDKVTQADSFARVAQWIERLPPEQKVEGSIPFAGT
jgi:hypothetical protein